MKRILIVEAHPNMLDALVDTVLDEPRIELAGVARTADEAISLARNLRPDVVLIDADETNWRIIRLDLHIGELLPTALVVRLSAATDPEKELPESAPNAPLSILKLAAPEFLRSLTA